MRPYPEYMDGTPVGRRVFLGLLGVGAAGIVLGSNVERWLERPEPDFTQATEYVLHKNAELYRRLA